MQELRIYRLNKYKEEFYRAYRYTKQKHTRGRRQHTRLLVVAKKKEDR